jgi:hypothetical protein
MNIKKKWDKSEQKKLHPDAHLLKIAEIGDFRQDIPKWDKSARNFSEEGNLGCGFSALAFI